MATISLKLHCTACGAKAKAHPSLWRCRCGGPLQIEDLKPSSFSALAGEFSLWRYRDLIRVDYDRRVSLGEGLTPLVRVQAWRFLDRDLDLAFKLDYVMPTGSFKDRGAAVLISYARTLGVESIVEDSSGNAGASLATYAAAAGLRAHIYVPAHAPEAKLRQIAATGARLVRIQGSRQEVARAAQVAAQNKFYASHVWQPLFFEGTKTAAYEIAEQMGWQAPDAVVLPCGHGTLLLGLYRGFSELAALGRIKGSPRLIIAQAAACAPLFQLWAERSRKLSGGGSPADRLACGKLAPTIADGIAVTEPIRAKEIIDALEATGGRCLAVSEEEILSAHRDLALNGFYVEPTSAAALAALRNLVAYGSDGGRVVVLLTGSGLKYGR